MRVLCPSCGFHHPVLRVVEDPSGDQRRNAYQVEPLEGCDRTWLTDQDVLKASTRFAIPPVTDDDEDDL